MVAATQDLTAKEDGDSSDTVLFCHPNVVECSFRSGNVSVIRMCARYQRGYSLIWLYKYKRAVLVKNGGGQSSGDKAKENESNKRILTDVVRIIFGSHRERWRLDCIKQCSNGTNKSNNESKQQQPLAKVGYAPLPPYKIHSMHVNASLPTSTSLPTSLQSSPRTKHKQKESFYSFSQIINQTKKERYESTVTNIIHSCCSTNPNGENGRLSALTLILLNNELNLLHAIVQAIILEGNRTTRLLEGLKKRSIEKKIPEVYVLVVYATAMLKTKTTKNKAETLSGTETNLFEINGSEMNVSAIDLLNGDVLNENVMVTESVHLLTRQKMVDQMGLIWVTLLMQSMNETIPKTKEVFGMFVRPEDHPVNPKEGNRDMQRKLMIDRKREIDEWQKETVTVSDMYEYCMDLTKRCERLIERRQKSRNNVDQVSQHRKGQKDEENKNKKKDKEDKEDKEENFGKFELPEDVMEIKKDDVVDAVDEDDEWGNFWDNGDANIGDTKIEIDPYLEE